MERKNNAVGQIFDLNSINNVRMPESDEFRIVSFSVSFWGQPQVEFKFDTNASDKEISKQFFSLLIGNNGVGKSALLREIIDFLIYANKGFEPNKKKQIIIYSLTYILGGHIFRICREGNEFLYYRDFVNISIKLVSFPLIIASTMGMFDKFPYQNNGRNNKLGPYDVEMYKYVGPKANSNMFSSKTYLMMQMLANLNSIKKREQLIKIADILRFIGYETSIRLNVKIKDNSDQNFEKRWKKLSTNTISFVEEHLNVSEYELNIDFNKSLLRDVKGSKFKEINELRQNGLLTWSKCYLFKGNKEIECNLLSSGEFNMLSIVMSIALTAGNKNVLLLLDEPEISQHPNWQIDIIDNLDKTLDAYNCHLIIATHCHFLVSNLPIGRSNVIDIEKNDDQQIVIRPLKANTLGWSAEEVLLKAFKLSTDRNRYLADVVGELLNKIARNDISKDEVKEKVEFLQLISKNLKEVDPMKKVISTITKEFDGEA